MEQEWIGPDFVGRSAELARLHGYLDEVAGGAGRVCFVTGEPGAGKSSLLDEFLLQARERVADLQTASGDCNPQTGSGDPYLPFREIMGELTGSAERIDQGHRDRSGKFMGMARRALAEHGPDLVDIFVPGGAILTRVGAQAAEKLRERRRQGGPDEAFRLEQQHLMEQYTNVLRQLAREHPLLLVVDDLHWADDASIRLLFHLARRLSGEKVFLVGAYRAHEVAHDRDGRAHPLRSPLNELRRYLGDVWIDLQASQEEAGRAFVDALLDAQPNLLDEEFRRSLYRHTRGHPLFTVELLRYLQGRGELARDARGRWTASASLSFARLPARVEGVIRERLERLTSSEQGLLEAASVLGESFSAELLGECTGLPPREVVRALSGPLSKRDALVRPLGFERQGPFRLSMYEFRHDLLHRYFYDSMDELERGFLHESAARALERQFEGHTALVAVQLARHYGRAQFPERAAPHHLRAGRDARKAFANQQAREHLEAALRCLDTEGVEATLGEEALAMRQRALAELAAVRVLEGGFAEARRLCQQAAALLRPDQWRERLALLRTTATTYEREHRHEEALRALDRAQAVLDETPAANPGPRRWEQIELDVARLWLCYWMGDIPGMEAVAASAEERVEAHGQPRQRWRFYAGHFGLLNRRDRFCPGRDTLAACARALEASSLVDSQLDRAEGLFGWSFACLLALQHESVEENLQDALAIARRCGDRTLQARCLTYLLVYYRESGQVAELEAALPEAERACSELDMPEYLGVAHACRAWLSAGAGEVEASCRDAQRALQIWRDRAPAYPLKWLALLLLVEQREAIADATPREWLQALADPRNARLAGGVSEALDAALAALDAQDAEAGERLEEALAKARQAGYL